MTNEPITAKNPPPPAPVAAGSTIVKEPTPGYWSSAWASARLDLMRLGVAVAAGLLGLAILAVIGVDFRKAVGVSALLALGLNFVGRSIIRDPLPTPQTSTSGRTATSPAHHTDSFREVVETIVFVVVLVLLLKSFAAEAFVIPTGSMAETLYGNQKTVKCPQCEHEFPVNSSIDADAADRPDRPDERHVQGCTCPNCFQELYFAGAREGYIRRHPTAIPIPDDGWSTGDRVLVAKFLYDLFQRLPDRLDVVVFKFPGDEDMHPFPHSGPNKNHVPMNYIKRLVGLPGETIAIHGGNLYRLPADKPIPYPEPKGLQDADPEQREIAQKMLWRSRNQFTDFEEAIRRFHQGQFEIIRKKPAQILTMCRIVYDNDHPAKDLIGRYPPRWVGDSAWSADGDTRFKANSASADKEAHWLTYRHILRGREGKPSLITDFMGYNSWDDDSQHHGPRGENWVGDLLLECEVKVEQREGELVMELVKGADRFRARWHLAAGKCSLVRMNGAQEELLETKDSALKVGSHKLRFANVDQRLTVWVNDELVFGEGVTYSAPDKDDPENPGKRIPNELPTEDDLEPARIGVRGAAVGIQHLKLWRDTYYTVRPSDADVQGVNFQDPNSWRREPLPLKTLYVQPGHFLCMGDNSPESSDGRSWGLVPERLLLGRALMVYFPLNRAGRIR